jgi:hypothetical protein
MRGFHPRTRKNNSSRIAAPPKAITAMRSWVRGPRFPRLNEGGGVGVAVGRGGRVGAGVEGNGVAVGGTSDVGLVDTGVGVASIGPGVGVGPAGALVGVSVGAAAVGGLVGVAVGVSTGDTCDVKRANALPEVIARPVRRTAATPSGNSSPSTCASRRIPTSSAMSRRCM